MSKTAKFIGLNLAFFLLLNMASAPVVLAQTLSRPTIPTPTTSDDTVDSRLEKNSTNSLAEAVELARAYLQNKVDRKNANPAVKPITTASKKIPLPVELALWQAASGKILYLNGTKSTKAIRLNNKDYQIKVTLDNGVNSQYQVIGYPAAYVVAVIHPVFRNIGTAKRPKYKLEDVVYVPYHNYLQTEEIIQAGKIIFADKINAVYDELNALGIRSRAAPNQPITAVINPTMVKSIIAIEHISAANLLNGNLTDYLNKFYTILATNKHSAYAYAGSSASALGIAQFIPSTYQRLVKNRPELMLNANFAQGMTDPYNAIKAQIGLLDTILSELPSDIKSSASRDPKQLGVYLAAVYNGGSSRVVKAVRQWNELWANSAAAIKAKQQDEIKRLAAAIAQIKKNLNVKSITKTEKTKLNSELKKANSDLVAAQRAYQQLASTTLKKETVNYVAKYNLVYDHLKQIDDNSSTNNLIMASE